jgi:hypothetical protein
MEPMLQNVLVGVIVTACVVFSTWRLMSPKLRLRALMSLSSTAEKLGAKNLVNRLATQAIAQLAAGCGACSHNKAAVHHPGGHSKRT